MPYARDVDSFIESSFKLLTAFPSTALSITYLNQQKKNKTAKSEDNKKASNAVVFKCFEPNEGQIIKYKTYKSKEVSRLLIFIGPKGVSITKKRRVNDEDVVAQEKKIKRAKTEQSTDHTLGIASLMCNTKYDITEQSQQPIQVDKADANQKTVTNLDSNANVGKAAPVASSSKNKKKKKKGKK